VLNKIDMIPAEEREARVKDVVRRLRWKGPVFAVSALAREGLAPLLHRTFEHVAAQRRSVVLPDERFDAPATDIPAGTGPHG
jgi:GTPase